jgi:dipeptidyl-peptidase-3
VQEVGVAFAALTEEEKKYAHFLSLASWNGALICLEQTSPESPQLFGLFTRLFSYQSVESLKASALNQGIAAVDVERFLRFAATFFGNMGNYLSFGDTKLVPAFHYFFFFFTL